MQDLSQLEEKVRNCTKCDLCKNRTNAVPGEGDDKAQIMFVGEGPGFYEDRDGRPFIGPSGKFLSELLASIGLSREKVYITNMVKCRPPNNRDPLPAEIDACSDYLDQQIQLIQPNVIVTLGRHSLARFFPNETITKAHGKPRQKEGRVIYPMLHPAAALHRQEHRKSIENDFKALTGVLKETLTSPQPKQLNMFQ